MKTVGVYEAKTTLPKLLEMVRRGEPVTITRHGVPIAVLQPAKGVRTTDMAQVIDELRRFRKGHALDGLSIREMIAQGRR